MRINSRLAARLRPSYARFSSLAKTEGARKARRRLTPAARLQVSQVQPDIPAFPARWFTAYTRSPRGPAVLPPHFATMRTRIGHGISIGMPGPHDFAVRAALFVSSSFI